MVKLTDAQCSTLLRGVSLQFFGNTLATAVDGCRDVDQDLDVIEIFTSQRSIALAAAAKNYKAEAFDIELGDDSILGKAGFYTALRLVQRLKPDGLCTLAPQCSSFGFAPRRWTLRNKDNVNGNEMYDKVAEGNAMARMAIFLYCLAVLKGCEALFENPSGSQIFSFLSSTLQVLAEVGAANYVYLDRCAFDPGPEPRMYKHYKILCSGWWIQRAVLTCSCKGRQHQPLMVSRTGQDGKVKKDGQREALLLSGLYPPRLGIAIVDAWEAKETWQPPAAKKRRLSDATTAKTSADSLAAPSRPKQTDPWGSVADAPPSRALPNSWADPWRDSGASTGDDPWKDASQVSDLCDTAAGPALGANPSQDDSRSAHDPWACCSDS